MLRRHGISQHCRYQHQHQREHEFEGDPLSKSSSAGHSHIRILVECRNPDVARARGKHENHRKQGKLCNEKQTPARCEQCGVVCVHHVIGHDDAGGHDSDHHRKRYCRETLQGLDVKPSHFLV
ncbi:MAG: hypothetical protein EWM73_01037 [Nitrospira sp.]|nr:MAG: hypothetical protein EWM73_01037 [Nitrospira sp.]